MPRFRCPPLSDFDPVLLGARRIAALRLAVFAMASLLIVAGWNLRSALLWAAWVVVAEAWSFVAVTPIARGRNPGVALRLSGIAATIASVSTWLWLAALFWTTPGEGAPFLALAIWAVLMINAIGFAFRNTLTVVMFFGPVAAVSMATVLFFPRFSGPQQVMADCGVVLLALYGAHTAFRHATAARALLNASEAAERAQRDAEAANLAKSAFLANMSHEIRTPLNGVIGIAQAMARDELPAVQRERLAVVRRSGETLLSLLNDLLDLSRIESGRFALEDGVVDVEKLAGGACEAFAALAADKDICVELDVAPAARGLWRGDSTRIRQILHNLLSNALKFTERGRVVVRIAHEGDAVLLEVADTGSGIPLDQQAGLFERFVQADASTTRRFGGSGLGLAICREIAELFGGEIALVSTPGEGSTFTVRLPLPRAEVQEPANVVEPPVAPAGPAAPLALRILAAEDNPTNQLVVQTLLSQLGAEVQVVADGLEAVEAYAAGSFDVVLMDVQMPRMDGPTAAAAIRRLEAEKGLPRTPILALTANAMAHQAQEYLAAGMDAVVAKPIQLEQLVAALQTVLDDAPEVVAARSGGR